MLMVFKMPLGPPRVGAGCKGSNLWLEDWNFQFSTPTSCGKKGLEVESTANDQSINQSCPCNKGSVKTQKDGVWTSTLMKMGKFGECLGRRGHGCSVPFAISCPVHLSRLSGCS